MVRTNGFCGNLLITDELSVVSFFPDSDQMHSANM